MSNLSASTSAPTPLLSLALGQDGSFQLVMSIWVVGSLLVLALLSFVIRWFWGSWRGPKFEIDTAEIGFGSGKLSFKPNLRDQEIAYKIWVELSTRKIGLPIDLKNDVISEVYDSWHNFFSITRELIKDIPVNRVKNESTRRIVTLSLRVLNDGLRPHLTSWQARFRYWYEKQLLNAGDDIDPQSIQEKYPKFQELKTELLAVNGRLIKYREKMRELVLGISEEDSSTAVPAEVAQTPTL